MTLDVILIKLSPQTINPMAATMFDFWTLLFSGFAFIGIFYSTKQLATQHPDKLNFILGTYLLLQSISLLEYVLYWTRLIESVPHVAELTLLFPLLYGPLLVIYVDRSFGNVREFKRYVIHFLPFLILLLLKIPFYVSSATLKLYHTHDIVFGAFFGLYYPWFKVWHLTLYAVILFSIIHNRSGVGFMRSWARWIIGFFCAYVVLSLLYELLVKLNYLTPQLDYFVSLATSATIFFIAWYGRGFTGVAGGMSVLESLKSPTREQNSVHKNEMIIAVDQATGRDKYKNSGLPKTLELKLAQELEKLMHEQKLFKQNDLKLETLAEKLNTSKHFVSQVVNEVFQVNFFEYINLKRVEEAKVLLKSTSKNDFNIIEIAYEVGFNNKGTFNSVFKKITGLTPTDFRKQSKQLLESHQN